MRAVDIATDEANDIPLVISLDDADRLGTESIGVKGWYLARLRAGPFSTPPGFIVTSHAYRRVVEGAGVANRLDQIWSAATTADRSEISKLARRARHLVADAVFDRTLTEQIDEHIEHIGPDEPVAVRSSATPRAVSGPECAGVHTTYTDVVDRDAIIVRVHSCWASLFGERALTMRARGLGDDEPAMAVVVQRMVAAEKSGLATPLDASSEVLIEATFGLGEPIISGAVEPDRYVVDRMMAVPRSMKVGRKQIVVPPKPNIGGHAFASVGQQTERVLDDDELHELGRLSGSVDHHFGDLHEVEWASTDGVVHVLQVRPLTPGRHLTDPPIDHVVSGVGVGVGSATGRVRIVDHYDDLGELEPGEVLVTASTTPEWWPYLASVCAVVTDEGDDHSHAAHVARELGIPAIVGAGSATTLLDDGMRVTVDAARGWVLPTA